MKVYLNNKFIDEDKATINIKDRGLLLGDSIFDTLLYNKVPFLPKLQGYFAEFLQLSSFKRLSTFIPTHLCRF